MRRREFLRNLVIFAAASKVPLLLPGPSDPLYKDYSDFINFKNINEIFKEICTPHLIAAFKDDMLIYVGKNPYKDVTPIKLVK